MNAKSLKNLNKKEMGTTQHILWLKAIKLSQDKINLKSLYRAE